GLRRVELVDLRRRAFAKFDGRGEGVGLVEELLRRIAGARRGEELELLGDLAVEAQDLEADRRELADEPRRVAQGLRRGARVALLLVGHLEELRGGLEHATRVAHLGLVLLGRGQRRLVLGPYVPRRAREGERAAEDEEPEPGPDHGFIEETAWLHGT